MAEEPSESEEEEDPLVLASASQEAAVEMVRTPSSIETVGSSLAPVIVSFGEASGLNQENDYSQCEGQCEA